MLRPGVYAIGNLITGDLYIGSSIDLHRREGQHRNDLRHGTHFSTHLQRAWTKYGEENFIFWVLEPFEVSEPTTKQSLKKALEDREQYWIDLLQPRYNGRLIVDPHVGVKHSPETRQRMSLIARNRPPISEEQRAKFRAAKLGKKQSPEAIQRRVDAVRGSKRSEQTRANMRAAQQAKAAEHYAANPKPEKTYKYAEEHRRKMSAGKKASWDRKKAGIEKQPGWQVDENGKRVFTDEHLQRLSEAQKRRGPRPFNEAHRQALSEAQKRRMERERQERLAHPERYVLSEEAKQKQREAARRREAQKRAEREAKRAQSQQAQSIIIEPTQAPLFSAEELATIEQLTLFD